MSVNRLYLLGFMASGKSFLGKKLALDLGLSFVDLDDLIEEKEACSIAMIFEKKGEAYFRALEQECLHETALLENHLIALGGGTPCFFLNMEWINNNGISFFLDVPLEILVQRLLLEPNKRPLLKGKNREELQLFVAKKLEERRPYYNKAKYIIKNNKNLLETIKKNLKT